MDRRQYRGSFGVSSCTIVVEIGSSDWIGWVGFNHTYRASYHWLGFNEDSQKGRIVFYGTVLPFDHITNLVPTVLGANLPGISLSIANLTLQPEQCPAR